MMTQWQKLSGGSLLGCFLLSMPCGVPVAQGEEIAWKKESTIAYLDGRQTWWMKSDSSSGAFWRT